MTPKRMRLAHLLERAGATEAILRLRTRASVPWLTILTYHRVARTDLPSPFDEALIDATPQEFDRHVATIKRYFQVVGVEELRGFANGKKLPPNPAMITFDDGYRDNHETALPILQRHGVKATFFVATSYVAERRLFWWDRIAYVVKKSRRPRIELAYPSRRALDLAADRPAATKALTRTVIDHYDLDLDRYLGELASACEVPWTAELERSLAEDLIMTWDHVRGLAQGGMEVQSHTRSHRVLQTLPPAALGPELAGSRADLERELGRPVCAISYPVSRAIAHLPALRHAVREAGYELGFSANSGVAPLWGRFDPLDLRRINVDAHLPDSFFRGLLAIPPLGYGHFKRNGRNGRV